nr:12699_t:CDS:2 [Entrophospora candida]
MALQPGGQKTFNNVQDKLSNGPHDTKLTFSPSRNDTDNSYINTVPALAQTPTPT